MNVCPPGGAVAETVDVIITVSCNAGQKPKTKVTLKTEQEGVGGGGLWWKECFGICGEIKQKP